MSSNQQAKQPRPSEYDSLSSSSAPEDSYTNDSDDNEGGVELQEITTTANDHNDDDGSQSGDDSDKQPRSSCYKVLCVGMLVVASSVFIMLRFRRGICPPPAPRKAVALTGKATPLPSWAIDTSAKCRDDTRCRLEDGCLATAEGVCFEPTFGEQWPARNLSLIASPEDSPEVRRKFRRSRPSGGARAEELRCSWQPETPDILPEVRFPNEGLVGSNTAVLTESDPGKRRQAVANFKHFTGSFFQRWWDWGAPIKEVADLPPPRNNATDNAVGTGNSSPSSSKFRMRGAHQGKDNVYVLENFCLRPTGKLAGYAPDVQTWFGTTDLGNYALDHGQSMPVLHVQTINQWLQGVD